VLMPQVENAYFAPQTVPLPRVRVDSTPLCLSDSIKPVQKVWLVRRPQRLEFSMYY
jgi:hypothetical protein